YQSFEDPQTIRSGLVPLPTIFEKVLGGHDVVICGYDDSLACFLFRNSYGLDWGIKGYGWMPYLYATNPNLSGDFWTVQKTPLPPQPAPPPGPTPAPIGPLAVTVTDAVGRTYRGTVS